MRIAIDVSPVIYGTGVSIYTKNLVENLLKIDKKNEYILFGGSLRRKNDLRSFFDSLKGNFEAKVFTIPPTAADLMWNIVGYPKIERLVGKVDIFHSSDWAQPASDAFNVTTVHDLIPLKFPKLSHPRLVAAHKRRLNRIKKVANRVIVPSQTTKNDLVKMGVSKSRIVVIPEAPDPIYKPASNSQVKKVKKTHRISGKYLLAIGITPRKNVERVIAAYEKVRAGEDLKLVVIGHPYITIEPVRGLIMPGHVPKEELPVFYSGAEAVVYPSLYEGFGLPILEAFACKTPVVTSNIGSTKEIAGDAAVLVDPYSVESITKGIQQAMKNEKEYVKRGQKRVKEFSWKNTAETTLEVYKSAFSKK